MPTLNIHLEDADYQEALEKKIAYAYKHKHPISWDKYIVIAIKNMKKNENGWY